MSEMTTAAQSVSVPRKPLRLWPGVAFAVLQLLCWFVVPRIMPDDPIYGIFGGILCGAFILLWWLFLSRAPVVERVGVLLLMAGALYLTSRYIDKSIATAMMGFMFPFYAVPVVSLAVAGCALLTGRLPSAARLTAMVATIFLVSWGFTLLRTNGISGDGNADFAWRWSKTHEEKLVTASVSLPPAVVTPAPVAVPVVMPMTAPPAEMSAVAPLSKPPEMTAFWSGFRGSNRDGSVSGLQINTDWAAKPPVQLWRRAIGPGWSSFAIQGDVFFTQEQRGEDELVTCYNMNTGNPIWSHKDAARFWEANAGAGPRATPAIRNGHVYTLGATGILNALDGKTGAVLWTRNPATDTGTKMPGWGFAGSPLVVDDLLIVAAAGQLAAYDLANGAPRWTGPPGGGDGYSSPHWAIIDGVQQVVLASATGAISVSPTDGKLLWKHAWQTDTRIMQPVVMPDGTILISSGDAMGGAGIRRLAAIHAPDGNWTVEERWTSTGLKPSFNDFVVYDGYVYGFDGGILACIDLKDGKRKWKGGRYGHGQFVLLRDQGVLIVLSEEGGLALVKAAPDQFTELGKSGAIEGKTWNHPAIAGDRLLVRNGDEMVEFKLALMGK